MNWAKSCSKINCLKRIKKKKDIESKSESESNLDQNKYYMMREGGERDEREKLNVDIIIKIIKKTE